jgi:hypothetical protein
MRYKRLKDDVVQIVKNVAGDVAKMSQRRGDMR